MEMKSSSISFYYNGDDFDTIRDGTVYMCLRIKSVYFLLAHLDKHPSNLGQFFL